MKTITLTTALIISFGFFFAQSTQAQNRASWHQNHDTRSHETQPVPTKFNWRAVDRRVDFQLVQFAPSDKIVYVWHFGDGTSMRTKGPAVSHAYDSYGNFEVRLVVLGAGKVLIESKAVVLRRPQSYRPSIQARPVLSR